VFNVIPQVGLAWDIGVSITLTLSGHGSCLIRVMLQSSAFAHAACRFLHANSTCAAVSVRAVHTVQIHQLRGEFASCLPPLRGRVCLSLFALLKKSFFCLLSRADSLWRPHDPVQPDGMGHQGVLRRYPAWWRVRTSRIGKRISRMVLTHRVSLLFWSNQGFVSMDLSSAPLGVVVSNKGTLLASGNGVRHLECLSSVGVASRSGPALLCECPLRVCCPFPWCVSAVCGFLAHLPLCFALSQIAVRSV
jgi:hypothetical protein